MSDTGARKRALEVAKYWAYRYAMAQSECQRKLAHARLIEARNLHDYLIGRKAT